MLDKHYIVIMFARCGDAKFNHEYWDYGIIFASVEKSIKGDLLCFFLFSFFFFNFPLFPLLCM